MKIVEEKEGLTSGITKKKKPEYKVEYKFVKPSKFFEKWGWNTCGKYVRLSDAEKAIKTLARKDGFQGTCLFEYRCVHIKTNKIIYFKGEDVNE